MVRKNLAIIIFCSLSFILLSQKVHASSDQAYKDYLYQADLYRQSYNDFSVSKDQYLKFKTLASEADTITKTKTMLSQRSLLLRSYLLLLSAKLDEASTMTDSDKQLYHTLINNEVAFLQSHSESVNSIATLEDATKGSEQLENHYVVLAVSIRQIILGLTVSRLTSLANLYSDNMVKAQTLLNSAKSELPLDKQTTLDRWFQKVSDKRSLYLQDIDALNQAEATLKGGKIADVDTKFQQMLGQVTKAKQELTEGNSYMNELMNAMLYKN